jgi:hypothetical protein
VIAGHQINRRGLLLSLLNVLLSPPVIGALCFALLFGFVTTLALSFLNILVPRFQSGST